MLFNVIQFENLNVGEFIISLILALSLGVVLCCLSIFTHRKTGFDRSFCITLMIFPVLITVIIKMVSDDIARAFSLAGLFALVRFRTYISDTRDIAYILATVAIGLAVGLAYYLSAILVTIFITLIFIILNLIKFDREKDSFARLKIVIPENLNYTNAFDEVFSKHLISSHLQKVKTSDFGALFELTYIINMKKNINQKDFIDDLRVKNGNLNILLTTEYIYRVSD